jgi:NADPH-dependent 2,4-dienoyl-CoA reductase/sulfur reductase-like enzyme
MRLLARLVRGDSRIFDMKKFLFCFVLLGLAGRLCGAIAAEADICVFGGTSAGIVAAVQARRMGKTVVLVEAGTHLA